MRKLLLFMVAALCFVLPDKAHAQRALPGMRGLEIRSGMVDGFHLDETRNETGYYFGAAMATYGKSANKWMFGAEYLKRFYPYKNGRILVEQFTGEGGFYYNFLSDASKTVFFSLGSSALAGYETVNRGKKLLYDGSTLRNKDGFLYGGAVTLEMETYLSDRIVLLLSARERILWGTSTGHFHFQYGVSLKFIIN